MSYFGISFHWQATDNNAALSDSVSKMQRRQSCELQMYVDYTEESSKEFG